MFKFKVANIFFKKKKLVSPSEYKELKSWLKDKARLLGENSSLQGRVSDLTSELEKARSEINALKLETKFQRRPLIDAKIGDPSPKDTKERAAYVAQVAGLHHDILKPKIMHMISRLHEMLEEASNDREYDQSIKGAIYFAWEFIRWGEMMVNEQLANQTAQGPSSPDSTK